MSPLTEKQRSIMDFIIQYLQERSYWPSYREIQEHFGFKSINAVTRHLNAVEKKGWITRIPGQARTFQVNSNVVDINPALPEDRIGVVDIPIYGSIAAGYPDRVESAGEIGRLQIDQQTVGISKTQDAFALKVRGESMIDAGIYDGDTVILETGHPKDGDIVAALIDGETTLKRFIQNKKTPYLKAENQDYPNLIPLDTLVIQGIAKAVVRSLN